MGLGTEGRAGGTRKKGVVNGQRDEERSKGQGEVVCAQSDGLTGLGEAEQPPVVKCAPPTRRPSHLIGPDRIRLRRAPSPDVVEPGGKGEREKQRALPSVHCGGGK